MRHLRVTMLSKALVVGAYQRKCELIASGGDVELTVLVPPSWGSGQDLTRLERAHTSSYTLREIPIRNNGNFHLHYYPTLHDELARARPDIVHIDEEPYNLATYMALRAARSLGVKTLFFTWQNLLRRYPPPFRWIERYVLAYADTAIAGNREAVDVWRAKGYRRNIHVIPQFGVDERTFAPTTDAGTLRDTHCFTVGYVGRLVPEKGLDLLLHAVAGLPEVVRLIVVGNGVELGSLRELASRLKIDNRIEFVPAVPSARMPSVYEKLDVLVLPSRTQVNWKEQFGRVLVEAMACGVPVVGSTCGEIPNVIGNAGLMFDENSEDDLRTKLTVLLENPPTRADLSRRGRARVLDHYTMSRTAQETVAVYRSLLPV